jgi:hypothetical protein
MKQQGNETTPDMGNQVDKGNLAIEKHPATETSQ